MRSEEETKIETAILQELKKELEFSDPNTNCSQWLMAVSIKKEPTPFGTEGTPSYVARVVLKTSDSDYVDGTDIAIIVIGNDVLIDFEIFGDSPIFHGGTQSNSLSWMENFGKLNYLQLTNPFESNQTQEVD